MPTSESCMRICRSGEHEERQIVLFDYWLFCNTLNGAAASAAVYSTAETAKANGLAPYKYLKHLLEQMPRAGGRYSYGFLDILAPWNLQVQNTANNSFI